jgi:hypothetical protein
MCGTCRPCLARRSAFSEGTEWPLVGVDLGFTNQHLNFLEGCYRADGAGGYFYFYFFFSIFEVKPG